MAWAEPTFPVVMAVERDDYPEMARSGHCADFGMTAPSLGWGAIRNALATDLDLPSLSVAWSSAS
jgi:hypothetical protein